MDNDLIADQAREIHKLKQELEKWQSFCHSYVGRLVCIKDLLNDSKDPLPAKTEQYLLEMYNSYKDLGR